MAGEMRGTRARRGEWLLLAISGRRQYAGNRGYADEEGLKYSFDSFVPNATRVHIGDRVAIRDREGIKSIAVIDRIESAPATKDLLRCPVCQTARIKERVSKSPRLRCSNNHVFDSPVVETRPCTQYTAHFGEFRTLRDAIPPLRFRLACRQFNGQLSIQTIALDDISTDLLSAVSEVAPSFFGTSVHLSAAEADESESEADAYIPSADDARERVLRQICNRRGQQPFRDALLQRYGTCVISGSALADILEAAHIRPYRAPADHHPDNGLLLRCDLHTLFDLDLLGIDPHSLQVHFHPLVAGHGYEGYAGVVIRVGPQRPSFDALALRWQVFQARLK